MAPKFAPSPRAGLLRRGVRFSRRLSRKLLGFGSQGEYKMHRQKKFLRRVLARAMASPPRTRERIDLVMSVKEGDPRLVQAGVKADGERALPGFAKFIASGWTREMLTRYALAAHYCDGKTVLDSCCGLAWGSYLVESVAQHVIALDLDGKALRLGAGLWPFERTNLIRGSALVLGLADQCVDVALAMESVEHFELEDIGRYLDELARVLKPGGVLVGSSCFPDSIEDASPELVNNPYHLHVCTRDEIEGFLGSRFRKHVIYHNRLFFTAWK